MSTTKDISPAATVDGAHGDLQQAKAAVPKRGIWTLHNAVLALLGFLLLAMLSKDVVSGATSAAIFSHPFQFDESESMIVAETMLLDHGTDIYAKPGPDLFISAPYPPLFYLLNWPFQHLTGDTPTFKAGRALSIIATLLAGVALVGIVVVLLGDWLAGAISAAVWWSLALVTFWGSLVKPDMLALALGLGGLWWVVTRPAGQVWWALPFFLGAFYSKQTAIAAAIATIVWLLITRWRTGLGFGVAYGLGALLPSLALNWLTQGGYFYHELTLHNLPWFPDRFASYVGNLFGTYGLLLVPGMLAIIVLAALWVRSRLKREAQILPRDAALLLFFYLLMTGVAATGTGTHGGNHNHLLDLCAASCLGVGLGLAVLRKVRLWQAQLATAALSMLLLVQVPGLFGTPVWLKSEFAPLAADKLEGMNNVFQYVTNNSGQAYSDNVGLLLTTRKRLWTTDPFTQTHATLYHRWDQSKLLDAVRRKEFSQIILRIDLRDPQASEGDVSPELLQAIRDDYKLDKPNVEYIYVPK